MEASWWVTVLMLVSLFCQSSTEQIIRSPAGTFIGKEKEITVDGRELKVNKYLGIPYAEPPVGNLRFKKPIPKSPLTEPFKAMEYGASCIQMVINGTVSESMVMSEDCLFLNVFVPSRNTSHRPDYGYSVMVWIHGGGYMFGDGRYNSDTLCAFGDVIVVTMNYRLGVLGFYSTFDHNARGNYGLWDQHLAIKWVHDNIQSFGGNPASVTVFGESAGAVSAVFQAQYPGNKGLFQRAIAESGTPTLPNLFVEDAMGAARSIANHFGCRKSFSLNSKQLIDCLMQNTSEAIQSITTEKIYEGVYMETFPTFDNDFIKSKPDDFVRSGNKTPGNAHEFFASIDFLNGMNSHETISFFEISEDFVTSREEINKLVPSFLDFMFPKGYPPVLGDMVLAHYTDWDRPDDPVALRDMYLKLTGDLYFVIPAIEYTQMHVSLSGNGSSYLYQFCAKPSKHLFSTPSWVEGANHGDEIMYVFGLDPEMLLEFFQGSGGMEPEPWEYILSRIVMTLWTNFAKTGNPNTPVDVTSIFNVTWPAYNLTSQRYLKFDKVMSLDSVQERLAAGNDNFWMNIVPQVFDLWNESKRSADVSAASVEHPLGLFTMFCLCFYYFVTYMSTYSVS